MAQSKLNKQLQSYEQLFENINNIFKELDKRETNQEHINYPYVLGQIHTEMIRFDIRFFIPPSPKEVHNG